MTSASPESRKLSAQRFEIPGSHCTDAVATGKAIKVDAEHATVIEPGHVNLGTQRFVGDSPLQVLTGVGASIPSLGCA